ncbi:SURF1 family protein [Undibacterium sp. Jales W-56]|uniref:SURF1 family protein n=1 Tax=Undibacterium sp. Jales W-56 TaxID=2897325 RepID=UPI0021D0EE7E|nr:SURF1 family protein [Undibacterium sp. Jales W-56]MCU6435040.1 SURF1 family protein [Undibacterium sp. Jales W-56]
MPNKFRFRWIPLLITLLLCALGISLGQWQSRRAQEKEAIAQAMQERTKLPPLSAQDALSSRASVYRRIRLTGHFVAEWPLYLDNRPLKGVAGFYVVMPFKMEGTDQVILVGRGWQARDAHDRTRMPALITPPGLVQIEGQLHENLGHVMQLGQAEIVRPGAVLQNLNPADLAKQTGWKLLPLMVEQSSGPADGLTRDWPLPSDGADKHRAYAFQWYALSLMAIIFFVVTGYRRGKTE